MRKILIDDDEVQNRELAEIVLKKEGYELFFANDGEEALLLVKEHYFALLILDLMMPKIGGFEVMQALQESESKIIIVSALSDDESKKRAFSLGADAYIEKPYDIFTLKNEVRSLLTSEESIARSRYQKLASFLERADPSWQVEEIAFFCKSYLLGEVESFKGRSL